MQEKISQLQSQVTSLKDEVAKNKKAMEELKRRSDIQDALNEVLSISLLPISLEKQLERILMLVLNIPWLALEEKGCIFLMDESGKKLDMIVDHNLGKSLLDQCKEVPLGSCLCGKAALDQKMVFRSCIDADHHYRPEGIEPHGHYVMPILSKNKVLGVLNLYVNHGHIQDQLEQDFLNACSKALAGIIERKLIEKQLHHLSFVDELTGVANRRQFMSLLSEALLLSKRIDRLLAVLFIDLDYFKEVNDSFGHEFGDLILIEVARRIELCIRETDLVARLGGDEFVVMLEMIACADEAMEIAENIIAAISKPYLLKDKRTEIGASIGISLYPLHDISSEALLRKADQALYSAKDGRGRAIIYRQNV